MLEAKGPNGELRVDNDWVTITRKSNRAKFTHGFDGEKRIPMSSITGVQFKGVGRYGRMISKPSRSVGLGIASATGYIQFLVLGSGESKKGMNAAYYDENSVVFNHTGEPDFQAIREFVEKRIIEIQNARSAPVAVQMDIADQLKKLAELKVQGILTEDEFNAQKAKLLNL